MQPPISRHETLRSVGSFFLAVCLGAIASVSDPVLIRAAVEAHEVVMCKLLSLLRAQSVWLCFALVPGSPLTSFQTRGTPSWVSCFT